MTYHSRLPAPAPPGRSKILLPSSRSFAEPAGDRPTGHDFASIRVHAEARPPAGGASPPIQRLRLVNWAERLSRPGRHLMGRNGFLGTVAGGLAAGVGGLVGGIAGGVADLAGAEALAGTRSLSPRQQSVLEDMSESSDDD